MMKKDLIVFSGQSNMQGQTEAIPCPNEAVKGALEYKYFSDSLEEVKHPSGEDVDGLLLMAHQGYGSLMPYFLDAYYKTCNVQPVGVHAAKGATTISEWLPGTERFDMLVKKISGAAGKAEYDKKYLVFLQGESDALASTSAAEYKERIKIFYASLKEKFGFDKFAFIRVGKFAGDSRDGEIIKAQESLCSENADFVMLTRITGKLTQTKEHMNPYEYGHYSNSGMKIIGETAGRNLALFRKGEHFTLENEPYGDLT